MMTKFSVKAQMWAKFNFPCVFMFDFCFFLLTSFTQSATPIDRIIKQTFSSIASNTRGPRRDNNQTQQNTIFLFEISEIIMWINSGYSI